MPDNKTINPTSTSGTASSTGVAAAAAAAATTSSAGAASSTATTSPTGATTTTATSSNTAALEKMVLERDQDLIDCLIKGEQSRADRRRGVPLLGGGLPPIPRHRLVSE
ncbi:hypothetical protein HC256_004067 [Beauveria bassiana]|nr:hypothetical protein HC256_004067 [Beauveria bassiana]